MKEGREQKRERMTEHKGRERGGQTGRSYTAIAVVPDKK